MRHALFSRRCVLCAVAYMLAIATITQSATPRQAPQSNQSQAYMPPWQIAAGWHMEFEVASVRPDKAPPYPGMVGTNVPMGASDDYVPTGGLLSVRDYLLREYIMFAYKLTGMEANGVFMRIPITMTNRYDIEARAPIPNPTKDQLRLMMQALLADRFKLKVHYERKNIPVFAMVVDTPGKLGPSLREHRDGGAPCTTADAEVNGKAVINANTQINGKAATTSGGYPVECGVIIYWPGKEPGITRMGARGLSPSMMASAFWPFCGMERPIVDKTGLGPVDFLVEFSPLARILSTEGQDQTAGPTFQEAVRQQLGLRLVPTTAPVEVIVIDHVEEPSQN